jgi:methionyl-tRNA formyltransferase
LAARINGLFPWPGCTIEIGGQQLKIGQADAALSDSAAPPAAAAGQVLGPDADGLLVETGGGRVRLRRLQRSGGRMLPASEFLRGFPIPAGTRLPSRPMPPLVSPHPFR